MRIRSFAFLVCWATGLPFSTTRPRIDHVNGDGYDEVRIGARDDGSFIFTNVPEPEDWYVYGKMESIAARGAMEPAPAHTQLDA